MQTSTHPKHAIEDLRRELEGAWRSERLLYRPVMSSSDEDVAFLDGMNSDPVTFGMGGGALHRPQTKDTAKGLAALLEKSYLAVMICLATEHKEEEGTKDTSASEAPRSVSSTSAKPQRIGFVCLGMGGDNPIWPGNFSRSQRLSISLVAEYQGKGYGTEAIRWVLDWAFRFGNLHRVGLDTLEYNMGARKVYEHIGFVYEGRQREVTFMGGRYWDMLQYSVLKSEWLKEHSSKEPAGS